MKKKILLILVFLIILGVNINITNAAYGITYPKPSLELSPGDEGRFQFTIQNSPAEKEVSCTLTLDGASPLLIEFDSNPVNIQADIQKMMFGTVKVPEDLPIGEYKETFCVECVDSFQGEVSGQQGASIHGRYCKVPINVKVVDERTRDNLYVPEKPLPATPNYSIVIVIILLAAVIGVLLKYSKKPMKQPMIKKKGRR